MLMLAYIHIHSLTHTHSNIHSHTHTHTHTHSDVLDIVIITIFASQPSVDLGLSFSNEYVLLQRGTPGQIFQKCVFWLPISNEGSRRCWEVFVSKIFAFKVFDFISWTLRNSRLLDVRNVILSVCGGVGKQWDAYIMTFLRCFVYLLLALNNMKRLTQNVSTIICVSVCGMVVHVYKILSMLQTYMCMKYCPPFKHRLYSLPPHTPHPALSPKHIGNYKIE